jgi:ribosomal protein L28
MYYVNICIKYIYRFKMTAAALKAIDTYGGIDNYILQLDNKSVADSNYITKMRNIIGKVF